MPNACVFNREGRKEKRRDSGKREGIKDKEKQVVEKMHVASVGKTLMAIKERINPQKWKEQTSVK